MYITYTFTTLQYIYFNILTYYKSSKITLTFFVFTAVTTWFNVCLDGMRDVGFSLKCTFNRPVMMFGSRISVKSTSSSKIMDDNIIKDIIM